MQFTKGQKKPANSGRKPGTKDKITDTLRQKLAEILQDEAPNIPLKLGEIESAKDYIDALCKLAKFVLPSLQSVEMDDKTDYHKAQQELLQRLNKEVTRSVKVKANAE